MFSLNLVKHTECPFQPAYNICRIDVSIRVSKLNGKQKIT